MSHRAKCILFVIHKIQETVGVPILHVYIVNVFVSFEQEVLPEQEHRCILMLNRKSLLENVNELRNGYITR